MSRMRIDQDGRRSTSPTAEPEVPSVTLDRLGRLLMAVNVLLAAGAFAGGVLALADMEDGRLVVEGWRTFGYLAFAGFWAMMALAPRRVPAVWELVLLQKTLMTILAFATIGAPEARTTALIDSWLVVSTAFAYVVCRGWKSWRLLRIGSFPGSATNS